MITRDEMIADCAEDIAAGRERCLSTSDVIDILIDESRIEPHHIAALLSSDPDIRMDAASAIRKMVEGEASRFFRENDDGIAYIDDRMAEERRYADDDRAYEMAHDREMGAE